MDILCDDKCQTITTLKKLAHFVPEHAKTRSFEKIIEYIQDTLIQCGNSRLSCGFVDDSKDVYGVFLNNYVVIMIMNV